MGNGGFFQKDPAMRLRDRKGKFATPLKAYADKAIEENKTLRLQCEKFKRAWLAVSQRANKAERELLELRKKIAML